MKKFILAVLAVFVLWCVLDMVIHGLLLGQTYHDTAELWRPQEEWNMPLMYGVVVGHALVFVAMFAFLSDTRNVARGIGFGLLFGLATGLGMGFGTYAYMPIPLHLGVAWFLGSVVECAAAGAVTGFILRD